MIRNNSITFHSKND